MLWKVECHSGPVSRRNGLIFTTGSKANVTGDERPLQLRAATKCQHSLLIIIIVIFTIIIVTMIITINCIIITMTPAHRHAWCQKCNSYQTFRSKTWRHECKSVHDGEQWCSERGVGRRGVKGVTLQTQQCSFYTYVVIVLKFSSFTRVYCQGFIYFCCLVLYYSMEVLWFLRSGTDSQTYAPLTPLGSVFLLH